jgi:hypothetical protein
MIGSHAFTNICYQIFKALVLEKILGNEELKVYAIKTIVLLLLILVSGRILATTHFIFILNW